MVTFASSEFKSGYAPDSRQLTLDAAFAVSEMREIGGLVKWGQCLDAFAARGTVSLAWMGRRDAIKFRDLGLIWLVGSVAHLTPIGEQSEDLADDALETIDVI